MNQISMTDAEFNALPDRTQHVAMPNEEFGFRWKEQWPDDGWVRGTLVPSGAGGKSILWEKITGRAATSPEGGTPAPAKFDTFADAWHGRPSEVVTHSQRRLGEGMKAVYYGPNDPLPVSENVQYVNDLRERAERTEAALANTPLHSGFNSATMEARKEAVWRTLVVDLPEAGGVGTATVVILVSGATNEEAEEEVAKVGRNHRIRAAFAGCPDQIRGETYADYVARCDRYGKEKAQLRREG